MKILALDTSTEACSVALALGGEVVERIERERRHGERLLALVQEVLDEAGLGLTQLDGIAFGRGPGSFTSLRIGAGVVQGLAFGADLPVVPVSSLAALAQAAGAPKVLAALDARMLQVYWGAYTRTAGGVVSLVGVESVVDPSQVPLPESGEWSGAGSGWDVHHAPLSARLVTTLQGWTPGLFPRARDVVALAAYDFAANRVVTAEQAVPVYIRDDVAVKRRGV